MPPEQMFELMTQMKQQVISNPAQTKKLLMENPQLAYALLQVGLFLTKLIFDMLF
jgi:cleavage stimulation factor subunit 2